MPTYDYRCPNGHDFEQFYRKISDAPGEVTCPVCGAVAERKVSGGAGLLFKGSGFYLTDYGKNAHRKSGPESSPGESKSASSTSSDSGSSSGKSESSSATDKPKSTESKPSKPSGGDTK